jgi:hypothetical protein
MKNIYNWDRNELSELLIRFSKTHYGKIQFVLSYGLFVIMFFILILGVFLYLLTKLEVLLIAIFFISLFTFVTFIQGSRHFYNEVRYFSYNEKSSD